MAKRRLADLVVTETAPRKPVALVELAGPPAPEQSRVAEAEPTLNQPTKGMDPVEPAPGTQGEREPTSPEIRPSHRSQGQDAEVPGAVRSGQAASEPIGSSAPSEPAPRRSAPIAKGSDREGRKPKSFSGGDRVKRRSHLDDDWDEEMAALPKYLRLVRKEARLREDQVLDLDRLVLKLNRRRRGGEGERITLNTLLRLGADLIIDRANELSGETEEELGESLGR